MKPVTIFSPKMSNAILRRYIESTVNDRFFTIEFIKADGSKRVMNGRLGVKKHLKGGQNCNDIDRFLTMYDVEKEGYRNIKLDTVSPFSCVGIRHEIEN